MTDSDVQSFLAADANQPASRDQVNNNNITPTTTAIPFTAINSNDDDSRGRTIIHSGHLDDHATHVTVPTCCCQNETCTFRRHNQLTVETLQHDIRTAAQLGHALLVRHETYVAESESERQRMMIQITALETERTELERRNASVVDENRSLLEQLEATNNAVCESDARVTGLQATLITTQQELHRLSNLAARTARLDQQLADFEQERATWYTTLNTSEEAERAAVRRWQQAQRNLAELQEQLERVERDAQEEHNRHNEVVARMQRRHAVENELNSAAGRLKGAAALKSSEHDAAGNGGGSVVSHFVKDILQDNANLQLGIVELREMLQTSNDEVEALRARLSENGSPGVRNSPDQTTPKRGDLQLEMNRASSQELHVHHHYHAPPAAAAKLPPARRKKKRYPSLSGHSSGYSTPRSSFSHGASSPATTILQQTAVTIPQPIDIRGKRWSTQSQSSNATLSVPNSPRSMTNRTSSLYERVFSDAAADSSRPTTPDSETPSSPLMSGFQSKFASLSSMRTRSAPTVHRHAVGGSNYPSLGSIIDVSVEQLPENEEQLTTCNEAILEEGEADWENTSSPDLEDVNPIGDFTSAIDGSGPYRSRLQHARSHESLLSVAGMDVHTLKSRPSQLLTPYGGRSFTSNPVLSHAHAHVLHSADISRPVDNSRELLSGMAHTSARTIPRSSLGQKVGGWVFGKWGTTPSRTIESDEASIISDQPSTRSAATDNAPTSPPTDTTPKKPMLWRSPGINQSGPILGFLPEMRTPVVAPVMKHLDDDALRKALGGNGL